MNSFSGISSHTHLLPLKKPRKKLPYIICDIESKDGPTQKMGLTRPFMVGGLAGSNVWGKSGKIQYRCFRNELPWSKESWDKHHLQSGGCVDRFMCWLLKDLPLDIECYARGSNHPGFQGLILYAHNGGSFDYEHVLPWLRAHMDEYEFEIIPVQSSIQEMQVKRRGDKKPLWFFRDSMKLLPMSLQKACKSFGVEGKLDHSLELHEDDPLWESYLHQDCMSLNSVMEKVHELVENKLRGTVGMTAPSTSMNLFRKEYMHYPIERHIHFSECKDDGLPLSVDSCQGCAQVFFRDAYYGGRTELFGMEGENLHYYDINSSYVAALCEPMPVGSRFVDKGKIDWRMLDQGWIGFAECEVEIPEDCPIPPLPYKHPNGKLMFPTGKFKGIWDVAELALLDHERVRGTILSVGRVVWLQARPIFRDMMLKLYSFRDKSNIDYDDGLSLLAKLLGNGLYGKFGQKKERTQIVFARDKIEGECFLCGGEVEPSLELCKSCVGSKPSGNGEQNVWYRNKLVDAPYIMPQIAAHVTARARIRLFEFDQYVLEQGGRLFMNDTDSLITDIEMPTSTELGALKDEYPGELLRYIGIQPKVYYLEKMGGGLFDNSHLSNCIGLERKSCHGCAPWKIAMKGFPPEMRTKENLFKLREALESSQDGVSIHFERLEKVRSMAAKGFKESPKMIQVERSFQTPYDKRQVLKGGDTKPIFIDELG